MAEAATGLVLSAVQTLLTALQTKQLGQLCSIFGYESQLRKLHDTVTTIKANLLDVECKQQTLSKGSQDWVEKLKDVVYDVDDLLDEYTTVAQQLRRVPGGKISKKVRRFFSCNNNLLFALNKSLEIKKVREKLDSIAKDRAQFGVRDVYEPVKRRDETSSYVYEQAVIGRENDKKDVIDMLLKDSGSPNQNISFVTIVGFGGLGKTTLAQLVYQDERIRGVFPMRLWVCVSEDFGMKQILGKMLQSATEQNPGDLEVDVLYKKVQQQLQGKRYLLVLDDVWNENRDEWLKLKNFLISGGKGSRILVTSRSKKVGKAINKDAIFELQGLSEINSWHLFKTIAFAETEDQANTDLVEIGKDIVKKCANVPLSIRVIGSLLYDQDESHWIRFKNMELAKLNHGEDRIMPTLMFSYHHLTPELKSCFSFCSLFPKDYVIKKKLLISLWLAQGFLVTSDKDISMEDVGEACFTILLNRCFFQDIKLDKQGGVFSCKMHDLIHDLAQKVAGKESMIMTAGANHFGKKIRHLSVAAADACVTNWFRSSCSSNTLRTFFQLKLYHFASLSGDVASIISNSRRLRVLDLNDLAIGTLPNTVGKLLHLRYLDLSYNRRLEILPESITELHNLQILKLCGCVKLKELPEDTSKLVNLRTLDIYGCDRLTHMPRRMSNLKNLHTLSRFVVGGVDSKQIQGSKLVELEALKSLQGNLRIRVGHFSSNYKLHTTEGSFILKDSHLLNLEIICGSPYGKRDDLSDQNHVHETLLEGLCPNHDISRIMMIGYEGFKFPSWASFMVDVKLSELNGVQHFTSLSQLCHLKCLELEKMPNVEYIESGATVTLASKARVSMTFFPVLEKLVLKMMPKLRGWWREIRWVEMESGGGCLVDANSGIHMEHVASLLSFPHLHDLSIEDCKSMTYFPPCPQVKKLHLVRVNEALTFCMKGGKGVSAATCTTSVSSSNISASSCLEELRIGDAGVFNSLFREYVGGAVSIQIHRCFIGECMAKVKEGLQKCSSSLRHLFIIDCCGLKCVSEGGIEYLTNLKSLKIDCCHELDLDEAEEEGMPWRFLHSLSSLELIDLPKLVNLPKGLHYLTSLRFLNIERCDKLEELGKCIGFLTSLQSLMIISCRNLKALPESLHFLTSLQLLHIRNCLKLKSLPEAMRHLTFLTTLKIYKPCDELKERCRQPDGEDWPRYATSLIYKSDRKLRRPEN
ncbi:putative disease resistance protein RGA3 [Bienertia sinuspersici]